MRWVVTNLPSGQMSRSSTSTWPPPSSTRRVAHGSGTQAPSMAPVWNAVSVSAFSCGVMLTSPPPAVSVVKPCSLSHARRATSCVLPSDGVASLAAARSAGASMPFPDDERRAARRGAGDDAQLLAVRPGVAVDRRVGPDEAGVERVGEHRLDDLGARVERRRLERHVRAEGVGEQPGADAEDRRSVGHVGEVPEAQRRLLGHDRRGAAGRSPAHRRSMPARRRRRHRRRRRRRSAQGQRARRGRAGDDSR